MMNFIRLDHLKHQLSGGFHTGEAVKGLVKCLFEQFGENIGKLSALRDNFYTISGKMIAEQQNPKALRQSAAMPARDGMTYLRLCGSGK